MTPTTLSGSDFLSGGTGNDLLIGHGNTSGERDTLFGGTGSDIFGISVNYARLTSGSASGGFVGYTGDGDTGFALIRDLNVDDFIELKGNINQYTLGVSNIAGMNTLDTTIYYNGIDGLDLIAVVQDATDLSPDRFIFFT